MNTTMPVKNQVYANPDSVSPLEPSCPPALQSASVRSRLEALGTLMENTSLGESGRQPWVNLHCHTVYSYNPYGYSPSEFAWRAKHHGLEVAGIVDFDVLDGLEEFYQAGIILGIPTCASLETRVYVPEFSDRELNSPGEPGISYHMGSGFPRPPESAKFVSFLTGLRDNAELRNRNLVDKVSTYLSPLDFDYDRDVLPLTPMGNATERHICQAYAERAATQYKPLSKLQAFWKGKLQEMPDDLDWPSGPRVQALIRARTMKQGGIGYVPPDAGSFPTLTTFNQFALASGAIPTLTWLDGTSAGEQCIEEWMDVASTSGVAAINIIPDRNFTPGKQDQRLCNLYDIVERARERDWPIAIGTEMNSPGLRFVDDFSAEELAPVVEDFRRGARILYAHTWLQRKASLGYLSEWAMAMFDNTMAKNEFYHSLGKALNPSSPRHLLGIDTSWTPEAIEHLVHKGSETKTT